MDEGIRRCKCGGWVHRARQCSVCKMLAKQSETKPGHVRDTDETFAKLDG